jgi:hypothetical protein
LKYIVPAALFPYAVWIAIAAANKDLGQLIVEKTEGIRRFVGLVQITGFNATNAPSKAGTVLQTLVHYGPSYATIGLGVLGAVLLLVSKDDARRRWGAIGAASVLLLGYAYAVGTFEEQFLYYLLIPAIITLAVSYVELRDRVGERLRKTLRVTSIIAFLSAVVLGLAIFTVAITAPDDGWTQTTRWLETNAPRGSSINVFGQGQFILSGHGFNITDWNTLDQLESNHETYAVISQKLSTSGYTPLAIGEVSRVYAAGTVVFRYHSRDSGEFDIIKLPTQTPPAQIASAPLPQTGPIAASTALGTTVLLITGTAYIKGQRGRRGYRAIL